MPNLKLFDGLSRDYIIHPGETIAEILEDKKMTQKELAIRTDVSEKHISTIINGYKNITSSFAKKLEYALGIEMSFWLNLQANYERELLEYREIDEISKEEIELLETLDEVIEEWSTLGIIDADQNAFALVMDLRKVFQISNLLDIPEINKILIKSLPDDKIDPYLLGAWKRMCEILSSKTEKQKTLNLTKLRDRIPEIKEIMFLKAEQIQDALVKLFSDCGIAFRIVTDYRLPVRGLVQRKNTSCTLCITSEQKYEDTFWITLFYEISHLLEDDTKNTFIDFQTEEAVLNWDLFIDPRAYTEFIESEAYTNREELEKFASSQNLRECIIRERLYTENKLIPEEQPRVEYQFELNL